MLSKMAITVCFVVASAISLIVTVDVHAESVLTVGSAGNLEVRKARQQNITIAAFDAGIPRDTSTHRQLGVFPEVRAIEARVLPFVLREILIKSNEWGAVRVAPSAGEGDELLVSGVILKSNGETLELKLSAIDAFGRAWVSGTYAMQSGTEDGSGGPEISTSFQNLFHQFSQQLLAARASYTDQALEKNSEVALLRYAKTFLPKTYGQYLNYEAGGRYELVRLPAKNDPVLERIKRIREFEYVFTDALDEQYAALYSEIAPTYNLWLRYQEHLTRYRVTGEQTRQNTASNSRRGSYEAMRTSYEHYKWLKIQEQNLRNWALGFNNEVEPTVVELEGRVIELDGSLEQRYAEWTNILRSILELETGIIE